MPQAGPFPNTQSELHDYIVRVWTYLNSAAVPARSIVSTGNMGIFNTLYSHPNPANTIINVELGIINENTSIQITDMLGSIHSTFIIQNSPFQISVADLSEGVYTISITSKEGVVNKRVVIVR